VGVQSINHTSRSVLFRPVTFLPKTSAFSPIISVSKQKMVGRCAPPPQRPSSPRSLAVWTKHCTSDQALLCKCYSGKLFINTLLKLKAIGIRQFYYFCLLFTFKLKDHCILSEHAYYEFPKILHSSNFNYKSMAKVTNSLIRVQSRAPDY
jgi:hypothetical protein